METTPEGLYIATWGGLVFYDTTTQEFSKVYTTLNGLLGQDIRAINYESESQILAAGTKNAGICRLQNGEFKMPISDNLGLLNNTVNELISHDSLLIAATKEGVSVFKRNNELNFPYLYHNLSIVNGLAANNVNSLAISQNGYLFCGSNSGLNFAPLDSLQYVSAWQHWNSENSLLPSDKISDISAAGSKLAVATDKGFITIDLNNFEQHLYEENSAIFPIYVDSEEKIWYGYGIWDDSNLGVVDDGDIAINYFEDGNIQSWQVSDLEINTNAVTGFKEFNNRLYAYTWGDGFISYANGIWSEKVKSNSIGANLVTDLVLDQNNILWVSNGHVGPGAISKGTKGVSAYDGNIWSNYSFGTSGLQSNNIYTIEVDDKNRKWFGAWTGGYSLGWSSGISILDDSAEEEVWQYLRKDNSFLRSNCISNINRAPDSTMWVCGYDFGVHVFSTENHEPDSLHFFSGEAYDEENKILLTYFADNNEIYFGSYYSGLAYWTGDGWPQTHDYEHWNTSPFSDLVDARIYGIAERKTYFDNEIWIASANGLYMKNSETWYRYGTQIKKQEWRNGSWYDEFTPEYRYIEGQVRLYGSVPTYPTDIFIDKFDRIWIGTGSNGISVYEPKKDKFTNYTMQNSPLVSNIITKLCYDEINGILYIGTPEGLMSMQIGIYPENNTETDLANVRAFPNPFYPEKEEVIYIENIDKLTMPKGETKCNIYDLSGDLVLTLKKNQYEQFSWDGTNKEGKKCSSGLYLYVVYTENGQISRGKIALVR